MSAAPTRIASALGLAGYTLARSQVEGLAGRMARALALRPEKIPAFVAAALAAYDEQSSDTPPAPDADAPST